MPVKKQPQSRKKCPHCGAIRFQGPYYRGEIWDGKFEQMAEIYQCVHCHKVMDVGELKDEPVPQFAQVPEAD